MPREAQEEARTRIRNENATVIFIKLPISSDSRNKFVRLQDGLPQQMSASATACSAKLHMTLTDGAQRELKAIGNPPSLEAMCNLNF